MAVYLLDTSIDAKILATHYVYDIVRMEVASSRPDYLPILSAAKTSKLSLLVKHHILAIDEAS